jgi:hypothetical protein
MQESAAKTTLVPIYRTAWSLPKDARVDVGRGIIFENVEAFLQPEHFELWRQYVSEDARNKLAKVTFALVHRFRSSEHVGPEEQKSIELMYRVFICLRLIKPTRAIWSNIQFKETPSGIDVFSFSHPTEGMAATPEAESFNEINLGDIQRLQKLLDAFLDNVDSGPMNVRRAIRHYELAYSEVRDPAIQFVTWMMALEQFYSSGEEPEPRSKLLRRISEYVDLDQDIYAETQFREVFPNLPVVTARETLRDLFVLRSRFVHGRWIQKEWLQPTRTGTLYENSNYADVLREVASWLVRKSLIRYFETLSSESR